MKIDKKYSSYLFASIMSLAMGGCMSFFLTALNTGLDEGFIFRWMNSFGIAVLVAFPISLLIAPLAQKIVKKMTD